MRDEKILSAVKNRDEKVMAGIIEKYSKLLWKMVSSILINAGSAEDIEECVADVFIDLWLNPDKYNPEKSKLSSYLSVVARTNAIDKYRQISRKKEVSIEEVAITYKSEIIDGIIENEESVKELKDLAEAGIITKDIYAKVLEENPALNEYLN